MNLKKDLLISYDSELTEKDIAAIKLSEQQFERGECIELDEAFEKLRDRYPESKIYR